MDQEANQKSDSTLPQLSFGGQYQFSVQSQNQTSLTAPSQQLTIASASNAPVGDTPRVDDDSALDEEWVRRAKEAVMRTHTDPYMQSQELSNIKAEYIKLRYGKDIKSRSD